MQDRLQDLLCRHRGVLRQQQERIDGLSRLSVQLESTDGFIGWGRRRAHRRPSPLVFDPMSSQSTAQRCVTLELGGGGERDHYDHPALW